jgi:hypothetical protein
MIFCLVTWDDAGEVSRIEVTLPASKDGREGNEQGKMMFL